MQQMPVRGPRKGRWRMIAGGKREPTPEETAAIAAALAAITSAAPKRAAPAGRRRGGWADRTAGLRRPLRAGVEAWRHFR